MVMFSLFTLSTWSFRNGCKAKTDQSCNGDDDGSWATRVAVGS
jgi:hypothetical protein